MSHFNNLAIDEMNKQKGEFIMFGGSDNKPTTGPEKFAGLKPGTYAVTLSDVNTGTRDDGSQYWSIDLTTEDGKEFKHWIQCEESEYKDEQKVYNGIASQMEALMIYDAIGTHDTLSGFVQKAIDVVYQLKGKTIEFEILKYKIDGKEGVWGKITGFLDTPNAAIQKMDVATTANNDTSEIPF